MLPAALHLFEGVRGPSTVLRAARRHRVTWCRTAEREPELGFTSRVRRLVFCTHSAVQGTRFPEFPVMCHRPCTSGPIGPRALFGGRRRRMGLRPCGIGESGGYLEVADHPRSPAGAKQSTSQSLARTRLALPCGHAPNGPPALDRPWVPVRRLIPVGSSLFARTGWDPASSDLNTHWQPTDRRIPWGASISKTGWAMTSPSA